MEGNSSNKILMDIAIVLTDHNDPVETITKIN
jgi:hypothetical protein